jgi:hypothetical protein
VNASANIRTITCRLTGKDVIFGMHKTARALTWMSSSPEAGTGTSRSTRRSGRAAAGAGASSGHARTHYRRTMVAGAEYTVEQ